MLKISSIYMVFALDKTHNMLYDITVPTKWRIERYWGRQEKKMNIIKRSGTEVTFDINKIIIAITKANHEVVEQERLSEEQIRTIAENVMQICSDMQRALSVEEIQDLVENQIMDKRAFAVARKYITYRYKRALVRKSNSTDEQILSLLECNNEEVKQENSNKILR